jgi:hypothetical protein
MVRLPARVHCASCHRVCLVRAAASYRFGSWGSNDCPADSTRIVGISACQSAAAATAKLWGGNNHGDEYPEGCYDYYSPSARGESKVYFNNNEPSGSLSNGLRPLCFVGAPVPGTATL